MTARATTEKMRKTSRFPGTARWLSFVLTLFVIVISLLPLAGCGRAEEERQATIIARARELLPEAVRIDDLLYVTGVPVKVGDTTESGYADADMEALAALGYASVAEIKNKMREIWTERYVSGVERSAIFSSVSAEGQMAAYAYVTDVYEKGAYLGVRVRVPRDEVLHMDASVYDTATLAYVSGTKKKATLSVTVTVTNADGETQQRTREIDMALSADGVWRLDGGTYNRYRKTPEP